MQTRRSSYSFPGSNERIDKAWDRRRADRRSASAEPLTPGRFITHNAEGVIVSCGDRGRGFGFIRIQGIDEDVFFCAAFVDRSRGQSFADLAVRDHVWCRLHRRADGRLEARDVTPVIPEDQRCTS